MTSLQDRIENGSMPEPNSGCWIWQGKIRGIRSPLVREIEMEGFCSICLAETTRPHDHKDDRTGLDDGPFRDEKPRGKWTDGKSQAEISAIRLGAWKTRREKYGQHGHR